MSAGEQSRAEQHATAVSLWLHARCRLPMLSPPPTELPHPRAARRVDRLTAKNITLHFFMRSGYLSTLQRLVRLKLLHFTAKNLWLYVYRPRTIRLDDRSAVSVVNYW